MQPFEQLEQRIGEWVGNPNVVACNSGTSALHLALESLELPRGSEVFCPDFTMVACPRAIILAGLTPVFVDCTEDSLCMDSNLIRNHITNQSKAVMLVHVYGRVSSYHRSRIENIKIGTGMRLIEDMAEAHGCPIGKETDAACYSFYRNKIVAGEEGGCVVFKDPKHVSVARELRSLGFTTRHDFYHTPRGHNYRLANLLAQEILEGSNGLTMVEKNLFERRLIESWYNEVCPVEWMMPWRDAPWVYDIRIRGLSDEMRYRIIDNLNDAGIQARHGFQPMSMQDEFYKCKRLGQEYGIANVDRTSMMAREVFYLPIQPRVTTREMVQESFDLIRRTLAGFGRA